MIPQTTTTHPIPLLDRDRMPAHVKDYLLSMAMNGFDVQKIIVSLLEKAAKAKGFAPAKGLTPTSAS